jgi:hypothetical protein
MYNMKLTTLQLIVLGLAILVACEPEDDLFRQFVIRKGEHYSTTHIVQSLQSNSLKFDVKFDASAQYRLTEEGFQDSKNKLLGFSDCNSLHHENSARFSWQWYNDRLEIYAYCYVNGLRVEKFMGVVNMEEINHYELFVTENDYVFQLNHDEPVSIERGNVCNTGMYYMLWPYFGGTLPAPHDVTIEVRING